MWLFATLRIASLGLFVVAAIARATPIAAVPAILPFGFLLVLFARHRGLLGQQGFAILKRDAVIVGVNFAESEEAVPVPAVFHEGGLERWLHPRYFRQIDVAF